jgi:hypothetical protein
LWLPCKYKDPETGVELLREKFHLLFSDGEIIAADEATLAEKGLYLICKPIYTPPRVTVEQALELAKLGHVDADGDHAKTEKRDGARHGAESSWKQVLMKYAELNARLTALEEDDDHGARNTD